MEKLIPIIIFLLAVLMAFPLHAQVREEWAARVRMNDASPGGLEMARDSADNIYGTDSYLQNGNYDFGTFKYNSNGVQQWVRFYNGPSNAEDRAHDIGVDGSVNIYVTGGSLNGSKYDFATVKYNSLGEQLWVRNYNGPFNELEGALSIHRREPLRQMLPLQAVPGFSSLSTTNTVTAPAVRCCLGLGERT